MQFTAFDVETTGFLPRVDQIVEIAAVRFVKGVPSESFCTLVNPKIVIPPGAMRIHGITDEMVKDSPLIDEALENFANFCAGDLLVAHNAPFDVEFIKADIEKHETPAPRGIVLDSCAMARKIIPGAPNYKLGTLVNHLKFPVDSAFHRAQADARFCGQLFSHLLEKAFRSGEVVAVENLINLSGGQALKFPQVAKSHRQLDFLAHL